MIKNGARKLVCHVGSRPSADAASGARITPALFTSSRSPPFASLGGPPFLPPWPAVDQRACLLHHSLSQLTLLVILLLLLLRSAIMAYSAF